VPAIKRLHAIWWVMAHEHILVSTGQICLDLKDSILFGARHQVTLILKLFKDKLFTGADMHFIHRPDLPIELNRVKLSNIFHPHICTDSNLITKHVLLDLFFLLVGRLLLRLLALIVIWAYILGFIFNFFIISICLVLRLLVISFYLVIYIYLIFNLPYLSILFDLNQVVIIESDKLGERSISSTESSKVAWRSLMVSCTFRLLLDSFHWD